MYFIWWTHLIKWVMHQIRGHFPPSENIWKQNCVQCSTYCHLLSQTPSSIWAQICLHRYLQHKSSWRGTELCQSKPNPSLLWARSGKEPSGIWNKRAGLSKQVWKREEAYAWFNTSLEGCNCYCTLGKERGSGSYSSLWESCPECGWGSHIWSGRQRGQSRCTLQSTTAEQ